MTLSQASVSLNADAIMTAVRDFLERSARESSAKEEAAGRRVSSHTSHAHMSCVTSYMSLFRPTQRTSDLMTQPCCPGAVINVQLRKCIQR